MRIHHGSGKIRGKENTTEFYSRQQYERTSKAGQILRERMHERGHLTEKIGAPQTNGEKLGPLREGRYFHHADSTGKGTAIS